MISVHVLSSADHKMPARNNQPATSRTERALRSQPGQMMLLVLALLPSAIVAVIAVHIWLSGDAASYDWQSKIWPVVILQAVSIAAFWLHACSNERLAPGELGEWILQFIVYIPFGMISYWKEHVWGKDQ